MLWLAVTATVAGISSKRSASSMGFQSCVYYIGRSPSEVKARRGKGRGCSGVLLDPVASKLLPNGQRPNTDENYLNEKTAPWSVQTRR